MNVNATLAQIRAIVAEVDDPKQASSLDLPVALEQLAAYAGQLDEWLSKGGYLPDAWSRNRTSIREA